MSLAITNSKLLLVVFLVTPFAYIPSLALAYVDPGTGSMIIQVIIAAILTVGVAIKMFWIHIKAFLSNVFRKRDK